MERFSTVLLLAVIGGIAVLNWSSAMSAPARDGDPILIGTIWKGKLTQTGEHRGAGGSPPEFECVFTVTKRDGEKFEAELFEKTPNLHLTYTVRGTIKPIDARNMNKGYRIEFESVDAKDVHNTAPITGIPYAGTVKDKKIQGSWKYLADAEGATLKGEFTFEFSPKKK